MNCIGIESTAHTFSCAVVNDNGKIKTEIRGNRGNIFKNI